MSGLESNTANTPQQKTQTTVNTGSIDKNTKTQKKYYFEGNQVFYDEDGPYYVDNNGDGITIECEDEKHIYCDEDYEDYEDYEEDYYYKYDPFDGAISVADIKKMIAANKTIVPIKIEEIVIAIEEEVIIPIKEEVINLTNPIMTFPFGDMEDAYLKKYGNLGAYYGHKKIIERLVPDITYEIPIAVKIRPKDMILVSIGGKKLNKTTTGFSS